MFTGIITDIGVIQAVQQNGDTCFEVTTKYDTASIDIGASIACAGTCLTVIETGANWFAAQVSAETLSKTTLGSWQNDVRINLERALRVGDELGGHLVSGHVDGVGVVTVISADGDSIRATIKPPLDLMTAISSKGSVTIEGVSLTVNDVTDQEFGVNLIPHTQQFTTLGGIKEGQRVNLEIDQLARYVARALGKE
jgi:riboflavin synthase